MSATEQVTTPQAQLDIKRRPLLESSRSTHVLHAVLKSHILYCLRLRMFDESHDEPMRMHDRVL